ncbi:MAG: endonuclease/exonuclease/phosphatase family protein [Acidobacteriota bacterium]
MKSCWHILAFITIVSIACVLTTADTDHKSANTAFVKHHMPATLSYPELTTLSQPKEIEPALQTKVKELLNTPFISNMAYYQGRRAKQPRNQKLGAILRVLCWNIERGTQLDLILKAFASPQAFLKQATETNIAKSSINAPLLAEELALLQETDLLILTEVDMGMPRTLYRNVIGELAEALAMNYAYGVEFLEIAPWQLQQANTPADQKRFLGLHGSAILSRYPIKRAMLYPLNYQAFDWFNGNLVNSDDNLDAMRKLMGKLIFGQQPGPRQLRRGGRMLLMADLEIEELPERTVTVAVTHLESSASPADRQQQIREVLTHLQPIKNPIILGGDFNTSGIDRRRNITVSRGNASPPPSEKAATVLPQALTQLPNPEREIFAELLSTRFADGGFFDFRGDEEHSLSGSTIPLANSNEANDTAYAPTFELSNTVAGLGKFKLDWIFVKAYLRAPFEEHGSYRFAPHFGRTLRTFNYSFPQRLSDHTPLIVDLPINDPAKSLPTSK